MTDNQIRPLACLLVVVALASASCIGSSSTSSPAPSTGNIGGVPAHTELTITYLVPTCPPGVSCVAASNTQDYYIVSRQLTCSPNAGGDYTDPAAVCRALADVVTKHDADPTASAICACPLMRLPLAKAVGFYQGTRRTIHLDGCSLCGLRGIAADIALLMPQA
jgi:hypothetical protein